MGASEYEMKCELTIPVRVRTFGPSHAIADSPWLPGFAANGVDDQGALSACTLAAPQWILMCAKAFGEGKVPSANLVQALVGALLKTEWHSYIDSFECVGCGSCSRDREHDPGCVVDAALTAAGFTDQTSRDRARAEAG